MNRREVLALSGAGALAACGRDTGKTSEAFHVWGGEGLRDGCFLHPRAIGVNAGEVFVIDKTGRVQVFSTAGEFRRLWSTPNAENGTPTAIWFAQDGTLLVPDTHYSQILEYTREGELLRKWGNYGSGPDQFIYPTGIAEAADGTLFISEYGENAERVHVFDKDRRFARQWGSQGAEPGQFNRAMALTISEDTVFVADTTNHRIQCFDYAGTLKRVIASPGTEPGQLKFPHDIALGPDGSLYAAEYGSHRISRFSPTGEFLGCWGAAGRLPGEFNAPRGVAVGADGTIYVADTDNHRVQAFSGEVLA